MGPHSGNRGWVSRPFPSDLSDPKVFQSIPKGIGHRLRITNSTNETFRENVELYSRAMAVSGYDYQTVKKELLKFENVDPIELIKRPKNRKKSKSGPKVYFNSIFDPRLPHPRKIISNNYDTLAQSEEAIKLFSRENIISRSTCLPNLGETLSPTVQQPKRGQSIQDGDHSQAPAGRQDDNNLPARGAGRSRGSRSKGVPQSSSQAPARRQESTLQPAVVQNGGSPSQGTSQGEVSNPDDDGEVLARRRLGGVEEEVTRPAGGQSRASEPANREAELGARRKEINGCYHCNYHQRSGKCDLCKHISETRTVFSTHFKVKHSIAGNNVHLQATQKPKLRWFVYLEECIHPEGTFQYVGSTDSMTHRWANTKSKINALATGANLKTGTGLEKHIQKGCSQYSGPELSHIRVSLLEQFITTENRLQSASHGGGPGCQCSQCRALKSMEDKWICRMGTYHGKYGLNERDEITNKTRATY